MRTSLIKKAAAGVVLLTLSQGCASAGTDGAGPSVLLAGSWAVQTLLDDLAPGTPSATLVPPGVEPHDLELTADDLARIEEALAVVYVGGGFQPSLERTIDAERDLDVLAFAQPLLREHDDAEAIDPHVWLDPGRWAQVARGTGGDLVARGLTDTETVERAARTLEALDASFEAGLASCARRTIFTEHDAFAYLADRYDLEQVALTGISPEAEATAPRFQAVADRARAEAATTVFTERGGEGRLARTLAGEAGLEVAELDPLEFAFDPEETYAQRMRANLTALRSALECA